MTATAIVDHLYGSFVWTAVAVFTLTAELEERERNTIARRLKDAHLPRMKTLEEFDLDIHARDLPGRPGRSGLFGSRGDQA